MLFQIQHPFAIGIHSSKAGKLMGQQTQTTANNYTFDSIFTEVFCNSKTLPQTNQYTRTFHMHNVIFMMPQWHNSLSSLNFVTEVSVIKLA